MAKTELAPEQVDALWERYHMTHDVGVRNELVLYYHYVVRVVARKTVSSYQYFNSMDDIINEGLIALLDAVEKFSADKNTKFETFASIKVRGAIIDYIRRQDVFPRRIKQMAKRLSEAEETLRHRLNRSPTNYELAEQLGVSLDELGKMQSETCALNMVSFEELIYEKGSEDLILQSTPQDPDAPERVVSEKELQDVLTQNIEALNEKEQLVIALYYKEQLKIKEISGIMGISDSRVSQIHSSALLKLKNSLKEYIQE